MELGELRQIILIRLVQKYFETQDIGNKIPS